MGKGKIKPIRYMGDPVLRTECDPVRSYGDELRRLIDDMFASMYAAEGVGLAANQVGVGLRVFVYDCPDDDDRRHVGHVVNPQLVAADGEVINSDEGCLSVPGLYFATPRLSHAIVDGYTSDGSPVTVEGTGYFARCLQHENGHLDGELYVDHLKGLTRRKALRAIRTADLNRP